MTVSHTSLIEVVVVGLAELVQAAVECGLEVVEERTLVLADGKTQAVDLIVQDGATQVGVVIDPRTKVAKLIAHDQTGVKGKALVQRLVQRYAYSRVVSELKAKGYQIGKEEHAADGTLKLVASRWQ